MLQQLTEKVNRYVSRWKIIMRAKVYSILLDDKTKTDGEKREWKCYAFTKKKLALVYEPFFSSVAPWSAQRIDKTVADKKNKGYADNN